MATTSSNLCEGGVRNVKEKLKNFSPKFVDSSNFYMAYLAHFYTKMHNSIG
jgi:hypothetical protein